MLTVQTKINPEWYTPEQKKGDAPDENPAKFKIQPLDTPNLTDALAHLRSKDGKNNDPAGLVRAFELGVIEWENVVDEQGRKLKCNSLTKRKIPVGLVYDVGGRIIQISQLDEDEAGNS